MKILLPEYGSLTARSSPRSETVLLLPFRMIRTILQVGLRRAHQVKNGSDWLRRAGLVILDGVACCEPGRVCWRTLSCIFTWDGVKLFTSSSERVLITNTDWRKPPYPVQTPDYATYIQLITWFLDSPSSLCPFSVHRMALAGKDLGKEVGQWFGPSTAAGAIKYVIVSSTTSTSLMDACQTRNLVHAFPKAGLGVSVATDSVVYQSDVYAASHDPVGSPKRHPGKSWGNRGVLVLIGTRLGIDGVNPVYYEAIKARCFRTCPAELLSLTLSTPS